MVLGPVMQSTGGAVRCKKSSITPLLEVHANCFGNTGLGRPFLESTDGGRARQEHVEELFMGDVILS